MHLMSFSILQAIVDWGEVGATAVSTVGVLILVQLLTWALPILRQRYPWTIPILAALGPVGLTKLSEILLGVFGHPVDFGPLLDLLATGGAYAVVVHQVYKQRRKGEMRPTGKSKSGYRRVVPILILGVGLSASAFGQGYSKTKTSDAGEQEKKPSIQLAIEKFAIGGGSFFDQESVTFSKEALYVSLQWHGVQLPFIREGTSTGIAFEGHPASLFEQELSEKVRIRALDHVNWRIWSITRVPLSAVPVRAFQSGTLGRMFVGTNVLVAEGGPRDFTDGFDTTLVIGGDLGRAGPGNIVLEIITLQDDVPISFLFVYGF